MNRYAWVYIDIGVCMSIYRVYMGYIWGIYGVYGSTDRYRIMDVGE